MSFGKHALVQNAGDQNTSGVLPVENDVPAVFHAPQAGADIITASAHGRIIGEHLATRLKVFKVADGLVFTPGAKGESAYAEQVNFGATRETKESHCLAPGLGKLERLADTFENVALGKTACVAFIDSRSQRG